MKVIIIDQFTGPSPYALSIEPMKFAELEQYVELGWFGAKWACNPASPRCRSYRPERCETVYAEDASGNAYAWRYNWDSSG